VRIIVVYRTGIIDEYSVRIEDVKETVEEHINKKEVVMVTVYKPTSFREA
jgi:(2Fe-2S) ferredoxin